MLNLGKIALFACLLFGLSWAPASSQEPPQSYPIGSADQRANSSAENNQLAKTFGERLWIVWERTWEDPVAFYTFVLSIFTGLLFTVSGIQISFLFRADRTARINADAAKKSADAAMGVALPRFVVTEVRIQRRGGETVEEALLRPINITLVNVGQSAAVILRECIVFAVRSGALPAMPDYSRGRINNVGFGFPIETRSSFVISGQAGGINGYGEPFGLDPSELEEAANGKPDLWVYGYVVYRDFLDETATKCFCARMHVEDERERFVQDGPETYSQTKRGEP